LSYQPVHTGIGSHHTRAKLPKVDTSAGSPPEASLGMHRINLNDDAYDSPEKAGPSRTFLPPGAASPICVSPPNLNREFAPPPLPPRRPADVGSMHTRRPSYNAISPQSHADELGGTTYEPLSPGTSTTATSPATAFSHSLIKENEPVRTGTKAIQLERRLEEEAEVGDETITQPAKVRQRTPSPEPTAVIDPEVVDKEPDLKQG
jgi:hypothetical protein